MEQLKTWRESKSPSRRALPTSWSRERHNHSHWGSPQLHSAGSKHLLLSRNGEREAKHKVPAPRRGARRRNSPFASTSQWQRRAGRAGEPSRRHQHLPARRLGRSSRQPSTQRCSSPTFSLQPGVKVGLTRRGGGSRPPYPALNGESAAAAPGKPLALPQPTLPDLASHPSFCSLARPAVTGERGPGSFVL